MWSPFCVLDIRPYKQPRSGPVPWKVVNLTLIACQFVSGGTIVRLALLRRRGQSLGEAEIPS